MTGKERILTTLALKEPDAVPTFEWFIDTAVGKALTGSEDPIDIVERLDLDAVNVRADYAKRKVDDVTYVDEWGGTRKLTGDVLAALTDSPIKDITRHRHYTFPDPQAPHRFQTLERTVRRLGDRKAIVLNLRDGWSDMRDLLGYEDALVNMLLEPVYFGELLERVVEYNLALARIAVERFGIDIIATTDDIASAETLLFRPETYLATIGPRFRQVIRGYKELGCRCIKHCDGKIDAVIDFWIDCGIDCLDPIDPGAGYDIGEMKRKYGHKICLKGNVDCTGALVSGTPREVAEETRACILKGARGGGMILSSSNTIHQGVRPDNYRAMLKAAREFGRYPIGS